MLAGPRAPFSTGPPSQSTQQQTPPIYSNQHQPAVLPPNVSGNQQGPAAASQAGHIRQEQPPTNSQYPPSMQYHVPNQSFPFPQPSVPTTDVSVSQQSNPPQSQFQRPPQTQYPSQLSYSSTSQEIPPVQYSPPMSNSPVAKQMPLAQFSSEPPSLSTSQQQYQVQPSLMPSVIGPPPIRQAYSNQGPPLLPSAVATGQVQPSPTMSNQFGSPPTLPSPNYVQQPQQLPVSNFSNQSSTVIGSGSPYQHTQYTGGQSAYNIQQSSFTSSGAAAHYSQNPLSSSFSNQQNLSGQPAMPTGQPKGSNAYSAQSPPSGPLQQPYQSQRIDPDMVPNVVQVLEQSQEKNQDPFATNAPGLLPPLAATNFMCHDEGSCNPRFMRSTVYSIPNATDMVKQSHIPIALAINPLADLRPDELEPPVTDFGEIGPIRCHRCKAYMCSFMQFIDGGKRFICCFCEAATDVPMEYFNHLDHSGRRMDCYQRPELCLGSYEILATKQYCKDEKWPESPAFIFMIDVSYNSIRSGLAEYICKILKNDLLNCLPKDRNAETSNVRVGFATFDKQIQFYNIKNTLGQPQMMIVSDLDDIFVPLVDGFLGSIEESRGVINSLLDQIPQTFAHTQETETILAPIIEAGIQALKEAKRSGKIYVFSTALPIAIAPGRLSNRDDKKLLGTEKEKTLLAPVNNVYTKLGEECAQNGCAVDLFVFPNNYLDLATIGEVCRVSGGQIYKFNYFSVENDGERLLDELKRNFKRATAFDALMRVRTSAGIRPIDFLGNFYMTNATEMIFGTIDSDKSVSVELKHDDKLPIESSTYIQAALLYTSISGQRRLRILTLSLTVTSSYASLYPSCDLDTIMNYITKIAVRSVTISTPKSIRDSIITQAANMLACYRKHCAQSTTAGQLILPETLKLLPVYATALLKCDALIGTQTVTTDDRSWLMHRVMFMGVKGTFAYLYPRIYALHSLDDKIPPPMVRCSYERFSDTGAYVIGTFILSTETVLGQPENGLVMYIWIGSQINPTFVQSLFGIQGSSHIQAEKCRIIDLDNSISRNVRALLNFIRNERNTFMKLFVVQQRDSMEPFFKNYLIEDKGFTGGASYVDFLYHLHREIRNILQ